MSEDLSQDVQKAIQDIVAPDVRELKVLIAALQKQMDLRFEAVHGRLDDQQNSVEAQFEAHRAQSDAQFKAIMAALGEFKAQSESINVRVIATLSERLQLSRHNWRNANNQPGFRVERNGHRSRNRWPFDSCGSLANPLLYRYIRRN